MWRAIWEKGDELKMMRRLHSFLFPPSPRLSSPPSPCQEFSWIIYSQGNNVRYFIRWKSSPVSTEMSPNWGAFDESQAGRRQSPQSRDAYTASCNVVRWPRRSLAAPQTSHWLTVWRRAEWLRGCPWFENFWHFSGDKDVFSFQGTSEALLTEWHMEHIWDPRRDKNTQHATLRW